MVRSLMHLNKATTMFCRISVLEKAVQKMAFCRFWSESAGRS